MQFQFSTVFLFFVSYMIMLVAASPIPISAPSSSRGFVMARLPEPVDSPLAPLDNEARALDFIGTTPLAPLDAEARAKPEPASSAGPPSDVEFRTLEPESLDETAPQVRERGCGRWACL
ncbi:hypothetical protein C8J55DRAFT_558367 [Lentinula edodes]|uniref:Uncharacterized protein n=1 Tax=Lentinula lateritia TaxID=40482 RepID=A0A9W9AP84_9AGAR|nr:hypothetical protein C8J55DRAFT_558367 [Lentinula edodes]